jgi:hypothetical protein
VGSVGGTLKRVKVAPAQATPAETEAVGAMFDGMVQGDGSLGAEWTKRVRFVAYLIDSDAVQRSIGEGQGVRAISDQILAGLAGVSASTVRRRSVDVSKLLPSTFRWG